MAADEPVCPCGCGASLRGWSRAGFQRGLRDGVERIYRPEHGTCSLDGLPLDQYRACGECESTPLDGEMIRQLLEDGGR